MYVGTSAEQPVYTNCIRLSCFCLLAWHYGHANYAKVFIYLWQLRWLLFINAKKQIKVISNTIRNHRNDNCMIARVMYDVPSRVPVGRHSCYSELWWIKNNSRIPLIYTLFYGWKSLKNYPNKDERYYISLGFFVFFTFRRPCDYSITCIQLNYILKVIN